MSPYEQTGYNSSRYHILQSIMPLLYCIYILYDWQNTYICLSGNYTAVLADISDKVDFPSKVCLLMNSNYYIKE